MRRTPGTSNEHVIHNRGWRGTASATGLLSALLLLASCGSSGDSSADAPSESEPAPAVERIAEPDPDCGPAPTSLSAALAIEADGTDCFYAAPVTITAEVSGTIDLLISAPPATCAVDVLSTDGSSNRSLSLDSSDSKSTLALDAGEGVTLSDADDSTCRFQVSWTPSPAASTTTAAPATTSTTTTSTTTTSTTTTTTTTTTKKPTPPPTTTSAVGS